MMIRGWARGGYRRRRSPGWLRQPPRSRVALWQLLVQKIVENASVVGWRGLGPGWRSGRNANEAFLVVRKALGETAERSVEPGVPARPSTETSLFEVGSDRARTKEINIGVLGFMFDYLMLSLWYWAAIILAPPSRPRDIRKVAPTGRADNVVGLHLLRQGTSQGRSWPSSCSAKIGQLKSRRPSVFENLGQD